MTRQFHARVRRYQPLPKARVLGPHAVSFTCYRIVPIYEAGERSYEIIELCDTRNTMRVFICERGF